MDTIRLRPEQEEDTAFLFALYAHTRETEMALLPWSREQKEAFLRQQFAAQTHHYRTYFPSADFQIILQAGAPVGRLYVDREPTLLHIIDISLIPEARGRGIGTDLLRAVLQEAATARKPVRIYVEHNNPAQSLYLRLGFEPIRQEGVYFLMEKRPPSRSEIS